MQMAHDHGRGNTLAGNIPQHKEQTAVIYFEKVAIVAAHHAGGLIVVAHLPSNWCQARFRQENALDASGQGKITLQGTLLGARKMVQTEAHQRIGQQALRFNTAVARLAEPECSLVETAQSSVHSL